MIPKHVEMKSVVSSQIKEVGHDPEANRLYVRFHAKNGPGSVYSYENVTADHHTALLGEGVQGHSIGSHFGRSIKANPESYPHTRLKDDDADA